MNTMLNPEGDLSRRRVLALGALLTAGLGLGVAGCSSDGKPKATRNTVKPATTGTITMVGANEQSAWDPLIKDFERKYPDAHVKYQYIPFANFQSTIVQRLGTQDPGIDVLYIDPPAIADFVHRDYLHDLTGTWGKKPEEKLLSSALSGAMYQDKMWSMPIWNSDQVLFYNVDLLEAAGLPLPGHEPDDRLTWDSIRDQGQRAQQRGGAKFGFAFGQPDTYYQLQPLPESRGGGPGLSGECGIDVDITNGGWIDAASWYHGMFEDGISPRGLGIGQTGAAFLNGELAFYVDVPSLGSNLKTNKKLNWGFSPHPYFEGGKPSMPTDSWHFGINNASENKGLALTFLEHAGLTTEGSLKSVEAIPLPPCNAAAFAQFSERTEKQVPQLKGSGVLLDYEFAHTAIHRPSSIGYSTFESKMNQAWGDIVAGGDPEKVLSKTQKDLEQQFERLSC